MFLDYHSNKREWQDATYSSYEKSLRSFFLYLNAIVVIDNNPIQNFKFRDLRNINEFIKKNDISPDKLNNLINSPCSEDPVELRDRILLELAYATVWKTSQQVGQTIETNNFHTKSKNKNKFGNMPTSLSNIEQVCQTSNTNRRKQKTFGKKTRI